MSTFVNNSIQQFTNAPNATPGTTLFTNNTMLPLQVSTLVILYTSSATAGSRVLSIRVRDSNANLLYLAPCPNTLPASQTTVPFVFAPGISAVSTNNNLTISIPSNMVLIPGSSISIIDLANIDNAGDRINLVNFLYQT